MTGVLVRPEIGFTYPVAASLFVLECPWCGITFGIMEGQHPGWVDHDGD